MATKNSSEQNQSEVPTHCGNKPKKIADLMVKLDSILLVTFFLSLMYKKIPNINVDQVITSKLLNFSINSV